MPCIDFSTTKPIEIITKTLEFLTDKTKMGEGNEWILKSPATIPSFKDKCIIMGQGDGSDEIYVGIELKTHQVGTADPTQFDIRFNGFAGFDDGLTWEEQPGCIYHETLPIIPLAPQAKYFCWLTANARRFILVVQESTQYEAAYCGFMTPIAVERQYPYPLVISASAVDGEKWNSRADSHSNFVHPGGTSARETTFRLRRSDGTWESALNTKTNQTTSQLAIWPQNTSPVNVLTCLDDSVAVEQIVMFPELLYECGAGPNTKSIGPDPIGIIGQLAGVYFVGNREDLSSKDTLLYNGKPYIVFNNIDRRENDQYFCIEWF